tara:strand:- start:3243 stop:3539 length:297 start_codon:yes stop_codon:yes gene_type:complete
MEYKYEFINEFVNCVIPKYNERDFVYLDLHIKIQELEDFVAKHKEHIEKNNGFLSISINKGKKDPTKLYTNFSRKVEIKEKKQVSHKEQMPDRDDLPF